MKRLSLRTCADPSRVVVIGASAAGLFTAYLLAKGGVPVHLFEERDQLGPPARTLIVTNRMKDALGWVPTEAILNRTPNLELFSPSRSVAIRLHEADWVIERERFIEVLARQARAAGVELLGGYRFQGVEPDHDGVTVHLESASGGRESLHTHVLVGADGVDSHVARAVRGNHYNTVCVLQASVVLPPGARSDTTQVWFDPASTRYFYWLIPQGRGRAAAGLVADDRRQARESLQRFLSGQHLEPLGYQEAQVPLHRHAALPVSKMGGARILLVGDAAAQVKVTTVGGAVTGLRGARAAALSILRRGGYGRALAPVRRELDVHLLVRRVLNRLEPQDYDRLLGLVDQKVARALGAATRDEILRVLLPSLLAKPGILELAARGLFRSGDLRTRKG